jgi:ring-1,2-phenylacetyl-CoA epoxidase subunit PaaD
MVEDDLLTRAHAAAAAVSDPEIPVLTIADLGILRGVALAGDTVEVTITPTYTGCPAMTAIEQEIATALARAGIAHCRVRTTLSPAWTTDWISEAGRARLAEYGIAPPRRGQTRPACPHCGSTETELISAFGSTPCKALHRCLTCREPFDAFKCH